MKYFNKKRVHKWICRNIALPFHNWLCNY